jgi:hypothetical protein
MKKQNQIIPERNPNKIFYFGVGLGMFVTGMFTALFESVAVQYNLVSLIPMLFFIVGAVTAFYNHERRD